MYDDERYRIVDEEWNQGWRREFRAAVDEALKPYKDGDVVKIEEIWVKKRGDTSFHDYRIVVPTP